MTQFSWIGLQLAEHWRGLAEIAAAAVVAGVFVSVMYLAKHVGGQGARSGDR